MKLFRLLSSRVENTVALNRVGMLGATFGATRAGMRWQPDEDDFADLRGAVGDDESTESTGSDGAGKDGDETLPPPTSVNQLRANAANSRVARYLADFDEAAEETAVVYCALPVGVVEDAARAQTLAAGIAKEDAVAQHKNELTHIEALKRARLTEMEHQRQQRRKAQQQALRDIELVRQQTHQLVETYYEHAGLELNVHLTTRQGEISQQVGEIRKFTRGDFDPNKPDWSSIVNNMRIRVTRIRGLKNKIPPGDYIMMVSKWDKLGGDPLPWWRPPQHNDNKKNAPDTTCPLHGIFSPAALAAQAKAKATGISTPDDEVWRDQAVKDACEICQGWAGGTPVVRHDGRPKSYSIDFAENAHIFTFFPSQNEIKPYNALVFELVKLPPKALLSDALDANAVNAANGLSTNAQRRPQVVGWGVMPIVDSKFNLINGKFRFPMLRGPYTPKFGHYKTVQDAILDDLENWLGNVYIDVNPEPRYHFGLDEFTLQRKASMELLSLARPDGSPRYESADPANHYGWPWEVGRKRGASIDENMPLDGTKGTSTPQGGMLHILGQAVAFGKDLAFEEEKFHYKRPEVVKEYPTPALTRWGIIRSAVEARRREKIAADNFAQMEAIKRAEASKVFRYAIHPYGATNLQSVWRAQVEYCFRAIRDELSLRDGPTAAKFWANIFVFFLCLWLQLYVHGCFQYMALRAMNIPRSAVEPEWWGLRVDYSHLQTWPLQELLIAFFSMSAMYWLLLGEICVGWLFKIAAGTIPETLSKFVFCSAITGLSVPLIDLCVDWGSGMRRSDWYRLDAFFNMHRYGAVYVWVTFVLLYVLIIAGSIVSVFLYTMALHLNGILQDAYWRIVVVNEDTCYIPDDYEVSVQELRHIIDSAERWRGANGERRKVGVHRLTTTDKDYPDYVRQDLHIQVRELKCATSADWMARKEDKPYREFYVLQEGTVLETVVGASPTGVGFVLNSLQLKKDRRSNGRRGSSLALSDSAAFLGFSAGQSQSLAGFFGDNKDRIRGLSVSTDRGRPSLAHINKEWGFAAKDRRTNARVQF